MRTLALCCVLSCVEPAHLARSCALARNGSGRKFGLVVASRNWPPTACAAARGALPDLEGLRSEAERKAARARKKLTKAEERAADCEQRQEELLTQVCADDVHMKLHPIMASTKPHRVERPPNCTRLGIHETNPFHTTKNIQLVPIRPHADHPTRLSNASLPKTKQECNSLLPHQEWSSLSLPSQADPALSDLEKLPNCKKLRADADAASKLANQLNDLAENLVALSSANDSRFASLAQTAAELGVNDKPPERPPPRPKKQKGPRASKATRLPYKVYVGSEGAEIRVGRTAADNDVLSCDPVHREGDDWWMHAAGCPGSHVIIRRETVASAELPHEVALDAAVLAANNSRAVLNGKVGVTLCKARQVRKPPGAKPGLVQLSGSVSTINVEWKREKHRLERLVPQ